MATFILKHSTTGSATKGQLEYNEVSKSLALGDGSNVINIAKMGQTNSGSFVLSGDISASGNLYVGGDTRIVGNLTFGDSNALDTVTVVASLSSSLIPQSNNSFDLGNTTTYWKTAYINSITGSLSGSINGIDISPLSASISQSIGTLNNTTAIYGNRLNNLEQNSSSLNNFTSSITASYNATSQSFNLVSQSLFNVSSSYNTTSQSFNIVSASFYTFSSSQYNVDSASFDSRLDLVEATSSYINNAFSTSIDSRLDLVEASSSNNESKLNAIHSYTSSLKNAIDVTGGNLTVFGDLTVQGNTTTLQTSEVVIEDKSLTLASGSLNSATADGAGLFIAGADVTMSWNHSNNRIEINKNLSVTGSISASSITGIGNVTEYSNSVDSRLDIVEATASLYVPFSTSVNGRIDLLETTSSYLNTTFSTSVNNRINIVEATASLFVPFSTSVDSRITLVESTASYLNTTFSTSVDSRIDLLESTASYLNTTFSTSVDSRIDALETFSSSQYKNDSSSFDSRISASTLTFNDTTNQTGIDFTHNGTQVSAVVSGLSTNSNVQFNNITSSGNISASNTIYCQTLVADTLVGATLPVLEYETNGTLGNILIKGATSKSIQVVDTITFTGLTQNGIDQYSATGLELTGSLNITQDITASGNLFVSGTIFAYELHTVIESSSVFFSSGSNKIGDELSDILQITGSLNHTGSTSFSELNGSLLAFSTSLDSRFDTLEGAFSTSVDSRLDLVEATSSYFNTTFSTSVDSRLDTLETFSASADARYIEVSETSSMAVSSSTYAITSSYSLNSLSSSYSVNSTTASYSIRTTQIDVFVQNNSGYQINKGQVVRIVGAVGDNPLIATASFTNESNSANTLGIATENIPNGSNGIVISEGVLLGVNTSGMTAGDLIYLGASGSFTNVEPVSPNHSVRLGEVLRVQQNNGSIYVRIDNGSELGEAHDVLDTSTTASYGDVLMKSGSLWINNSTFSSSLDSRILINSQSAWGAFQSASAYSQSFSSSLSSLSASLSNRLIIEEFKSTTFATTGSNTFTATQIISGSLFVTGDVVAYSPSDERLKTNIELISNPIEKVQQLRGVEFEWKDGLPKAGTKEYGVIAQDVLNVLPYLVHQRIDGYLAVDYEKMVSLLIEVVKEQEKRIKNLENKLNQ